MPVMSVVYPSPPDLGAMDQRHKMNCSSTIAFLVSIQRDEVKRKKESCTMRN